MSVMAAVLLWGIAGAPAPPTSPPPPPPEIRLEVAVPGVGTVDTSGLTLRAYADQPVEITVRTFDAVTGAPFDATSWPGPLLEAVAPAPYPAAVVSLSVVDTGVYTRRFPVPHVGLWTFVTLPELTDRTALAPGSTDFISVDVVSGAAPAPASGSAVAAGVLVLLVAFGVYVIVATSRRRRVPKAPVHQDSWWWGT